MYGSDIALFFKSSDGNYLLERRYVEGSNIKPVLAPIQSLELIFGYQGDSNNAITAFIFQRSTKTPCHSTLSEIFLDGRGQHIIYAFGQSNVFGYHNPLHRGNSFIDFSLKTVDVKYPSDALTFSFKTPPIRVLPDNPTTYCYSFHYMPQDKPYHMIGYEPIINSSLIHHMIGFSCSKDIGGLYPVGKVNCINTASEAVLIIKFRRLDRNIV
jgi:hypothetical protein